MAFRQHVATVLAFAFIAGVIIFSGRHGRHVAAEPTASSFDTLIAAHQK